jgi:signal transduction histidine kinase
MNQQNDLKLLVAKYNNLMLLIRGISHELKNPLMAARGAAELIMEKGCTLGKNKCKDLMGRALHSLDTAGNCLKSLDMIESSNEMRQELRVINLDSFLENLIKLIAIFMDVKKVKHIFFNKGDFTNIKIETRPDDLYHIISNLIINASQACNQSENSAISLFRKMNCDENYIIVGIGDNGNGIPKQYIKKVLKIGFTTKGNGAGSGLMIVKTLCEKNNIGIFFTSKKNIGTKFYLKIKKSENNI